jgi:protein-disulfide isomerase
VRKRETVRRLWLSVLAAALVAVASACAAQPALTPTPATAAKDDGSVVSLEKTVVAQQTQVASLQKQVVALQTAVIPQGAGQAGPDTAPAAQVPAIPTLMPPVAGIAVDGASKGSPQAKVTITEYSDFQ